MRLTRYAALAAALLCVCGISYGQSEVGSFPNAAPLNGSERMLSDQNAATVDITPAQIGQYLGIPNGLVFPLSVTNGGTGTATPSLIGAGGITITGSWPNQTITGGASFPSCTADQLYYAAATGTTASCLTLGTNLSITSGTLNATAGGGGVASITGDGALITNSGSTGGVTLTLGATGVGYGVWGNIGAASGAPSYHALSTYPTSAFPTLNQSTTGTAANITAASNSTLTTLSALSLPSTQITGLGALATLTPGTGIAAALGVNVGTAGAPVINGGALGTPSSGTLTNATGLPISTGVSGLGAGVATFLATPSAANLGSAVTGAGLIAGTNVTITGTWPNQTVSATAGGGGVSSFTGDGALLNNSASVGAVTATLANTGVGYSVWGNTGSSSGAPGYHALSSYPAAAFPTLNQSTTGTAANITATSNSTLTTLSALTSANGSTVPASDGTLLGTGSLGTGVNTALGTAVGSAGAFVVYGGAGGTPSSINLSNATNLPNSALPTSGATAGSYTNANITVNAQGIVTAAANGSATAITVQTNGTNNASQSTLNIENGPGINCSNPSSGNVQCSTTAANRTVTTSPTVASTDMGGQIVMNVSGGGTLTIPAISSTVFAAGMSLSVVNYSASTAAVSTTPTVNSGGGCVTATGIPSGDSWQLLSNGTTLDCIQTVSGAGGGGTVTTTGTPASSYLAGFSGATSITGTANATLSGGALTLGVSGTSGSIKMGNATSGTLTLQPVAGALGTVTVSIPDATDTLVNLTSTQTLTNKTLTSPTLTTPALGTPASGVMTNLTGTPSSIGLNNATAGSLPLTGIATIANNTVLGNVSGSTASPTAVTGVSYLLDEGTKFTIASGTGACATTTTLTGGTAVGTFVCSGTTGSSTAVITLPSATNSIWICMARDKTTPANAISETTWTGTSATLSGTVTSGDTIGFACVGS